MPPFFDFLAIIYFLFSNSMIFSSPVCFDTLPSVSLIEWLDFLSFDISFYILLKRGGRGEGEKQQRHEYNEGEVKVFSCGTHFLYSSTTYKARWRCRPGGVGRPPSFGTIPFG
jgi:hypothetical protein